MSIVMVSSKTKEEILAGIKTMLVSEASTPEKQEEVKNLSLGQFEKFEKQVSDKNARIIEAKAERKTALLNDDDETADKLTDEIKSLQKWLQENPPATLEEIVSWNKAQLVSDVQVISEYDKWSAIFGLESKKTAGKPVSADKEHKVEAKFENIWARELTNGAKVVNFRILTDEQKSRNQLTNANQWIVKVGDKTQVVEAASPNALIMVSKMLLGQSVASPVNNSMWNDGQNLSASEIASF